jgi:hypothetical protein
MRRTALEDVGFYDESFKMAQDRELFYRLMIRYDLGMVPEFLLKRRMLPTSIGIINEREQKEYNFRAMRKAIKCGIYPFWYYIYVLPMLVGASFPEPLMQMKKDIMRRMGLRHDVPVIGEQHEDTYRQ